MTKPIVSIAKVAARFLPNFLKQSMYRLGPISRAIRNGLNASLPNEIQAVEISAGLLRGQMMFLDLQSEKDFWLGAYEDPLIDALKRKSKKGMLSYDIGANIGYISLIMARLNGSQGQVISFEAHPENIARLQENIEINNLSQQIKCIPKAVSETSGKASFLVHASGAMGKLSDAFGRDENYKNQFEVDTIALDDFIYRDKHPAPDMIKIDIEGAEGLALMGMRRLLKEAKPTLLIELHGPEAAKTVWEELSEADYSVRALKKGYPVVHDLESMNWKSYIVAEAE